MTGVNDDVVGTGSNDRLGWDDVGDWLFDELLLAISKDLIIFECCFLRRSLSKCFLYISGVFFSAALHCCFLNLSFSFFASLIDCQYTLHISALFKPLYFPPFEPVLRRRKYA